MLSLALWACAKAPEGGAELGDRGDDISTADDAEDEDDVSVDEEEDEEEQSDDEDSQEPEVEDDDPGPIDAGTDASVPRDAGPARDASPLVVGGDAEAGAPVDAGGPRDTGVAQVDTGVVPPGPPCLPGSYVGSFQGDLNAVLAFVRAEVSGEVSLQLALASGGKALTIQNGTLDGVDDEGDAFVARITGTVDCTTRQLDAELVDGEYRRLLRQRFVGTATGTYSNNPSLQGTLTFESDNGRNGGSATFSAALR